MSLREKLSAEILGERIARAWSAVKRYLTLQPPVPEFVSYVPEPPTVERSLSHIAQLLSDIAYYAGEQKPVTVFNHNDSKSSVNNNVVVPEVPFEDRIVTAVVQATTTNGLLNSSDAVQKDYANKVYKLTAAVIAARNRNSRLISEAHWSPLS